MRDYGTGQWAGGDAECDHVQPTGTTRGGPHSTLSGGQDTTAHGAQYKDTCGKCGATRIDKQLGLEATPDEFVANMVAVFREVRRVLRSDGQLWLNIGDSYAGGPGGAQGGTGQRASRTFTAKVPRKDGCGLKPKDLAMIPARLALALQADGWWIRSEITWCKRAPMPESVRDRPTSATEKIYLLTRSEKYFYDADAVREPNSPTSHPGTYRNVHKNEGMGEGMGQSFRPGKVVLDYSGRNQWNYSFLPADRWRLRADLTPEQRAYVLQRICGVGYPVEGGNPESNNGHSDV